MPVSPLFETVEAFAAVARDLPDAALERDLAWNGADTDVRWHLFLVYEELRDLAAALAAERSHRGPPVTVAQRALAQHHAAYLDLRGLLLAAEAVDLDQPPAEGEWPLRLVLAHMLRGENGFIRRLRGAVDAARQGEAPRQPSDGGSSSSDLPAEARGSLPEILGHFDALHARTLAEFADLRPEDLSAPFVFWFTADIRFQLFRFDAHLREHTIQAEKLLETIAPRPSDTLRTLRLVYRALGEAEGWLIGADDLGAALQDAALARLRAESALLGATPRS